MSDLTQAREALADRDRLDTVTGKGGIAWLATPENMALANRVRAEDAWTHLRDALAEVDRLTADRDKYRDLYRELAASISPRSNR